MEPFGSWRAVSQVHGVVEEALQNLKVYFDTPGIMYPVQEDELVERSGKRPINYKLLQGLDNFC